MAMKTTDIQATRRNSNSSVEKAKMDRTFVSFLKGVKHQKAFTFLPGRGSGPGW